THDIELTDIMAEKYRSVHFTERIEDDNVIFDYKVREGAAKTRNAIKLMKINGFPKEITDMAERIANNSDTE
ncbi:MAG: DNA mismatch repair protein MutS, partial [Oscillospiraceae bacterium]|nr:DNA mismatch repair protein MutS [Oscillospiraceae bacterium]